MGGVGGVVAAAPAMAAVQTPFRRNLVGSAVSDETATCTTSTAELVASNADFSLLGGVSVPFQRHL